MRMFRWESGALPSVRHSMVAFETNRFGTVASIQRNKNRYVEVVGLRVRFPTLVSFCLYFLSRIFHAVIWNDNK